MEQENLFSSSSSDDGAETISVTPPKLKHAYSNRFFNKSSMSKHLENPIVEAPEET